MSLGFEGASNDAFEVVLRVLVPPGARASALPGADGFRALGGGGVGATCSQRDGMAPPGTANALDDEFTGSLTGWSTFNAGSVTFSATTETAQQMLVLECATVPGDRLVGIYKAAPTASSGDYTYAFWSKVSWVSLDASDFPNVGIFIAEDLAGSPTSDNTWNDVLDRQENTFHDRPRGRDGYPTHSGDKLKTPNQTVT